MQIFKVCLKKEKYFKYFLRQVSAYNIDKHIDFFGDCCWYFLLVLVKNFELKTVNSNVNCIHHKFFDLWWFRRNSLNEIYES